MKLDTEDVVILDGDSQEGGASVINIDDDTTEVRCKPERPENVSAKTLFYLTKVRGISAHHNRPDVAIGIKGKRE